MLQPKIPFKISLKPLFTELQLKNHICVIPILITFYKIRKENQLNIIKQARKLMIDNQLFS